MPDSVLANWFVNLIPIFKNVLMGHGQTWSEIFFNSYFAFNDYSHGAKFFLFIIPVLS